MLNKLLHNLLTASIIITATFNSSYAKPSLINQSELSEIIADAAQIGIEQPQEIIDIKSQLDNLEIIQQEKIKELGIAGITHTARSTLIQKLNLELAEIEKEINRTEDNLLKACLHYSIMISQTCQEIESEYINTSKTYRPESNEFQKIKSRLSAGKRLKQKFQSYQILYQARQILTSPQKNLFDSITAYARLLSLDPGNNEAIEYCQEMLKWDSSDDNIFLLDNIDQLSSDTINTLYNNGIEITKYGSQGIELCWIPSGSYSKEAIQQTGIVKKKANSEIIITKGFWLSKYEITVGQYLEFLNSVETFDNNANYFRNRAETEIINLKLDKYNCYQTTNDIFLGNANKPMIMVSYNDAIAFCKWLSDLDGKQYTLPTEAEWELAARTTFETKWHFGDDIQMLDNYACYGKLSQLATEEVGKLKPNLYGLYDIYGNTWEWCRDWYGNNPFSPGTITDPQGLKFSNEKVIRGGSWQSTPDMCSSSGRSSANPELKDKAIGFRIMQIMK